MDARDEPIIQGTYLMPHNTTAFEAFLREVENALLLHIT